MNILGIARARSLFALALVSTAFACGGHLTTQEAYEVCGELGKDTPLSDESVVACVACYERCDDCTYDGGEFICPDDVEEGSGGGESE